MASQASGCVPEPRFSVRMLCTALYVVSYFVSLSVCISLLVGAWHAGGSEDERDFPLRVIRKKGGKMVKNYHFFFCEMFKLARRFLTLERTIPSISSRCF